MSNYALDDLDRITITKDGVMANTKDGVMANTKDDPIMRPLDHHIYVNRHERRKAQALRRRDIRKGRYEW